MANYVAGTDHHNFKHGLRKTKAFGVWWQMIQRCRNPNVKSYPRYGGRGIAVCDRWKDFSNFLADMGHPPDGMSLDRRDNNGNYEPTNCRWATPQEQIRNRSTSKLTFDAAYWIRIEIENGASKKQLAREHGVSASVIGNIANGRIWKDAVQSAEADVLEIETAEARGELYCIPEQVAHLGHA